MSGEMTERTMSKAKTLMKTLNVRVSVLPLLPAQEDSRHRPRILDSNSSYLERHLPIMHQYHSSTIIFF